MNRRTWLVPLYLLLACPSDDGDDMPTTLGNGTGSGSTTQTTEATDAANDSTSTGAGTEADDGSGDASSESGATEGSGSESGGALACGDPGTNSMIGRDGSCHCDAGFTWCTLELDDYTCCEDIGMKGRCTDPNATQVDGLCFCNRGFEWCNPEDPEDLSCCAMR